MIWVIEAVLGILSGMFSAMGVGGSSILIMGLTVLLNSPQLTAQGIGLIFYIPAAITATIVYSKKKIIEWDISIPCALAGLLGSLIGFYISSVIDAYYLSKVFGVMLIIIGIFQIK
jgi:uncharacterized membrane protein YfcA